MNGTLVCSVNQLTHNLSHERLCLIGCGLYLFMGNLDNLTLYAKVGDYGHAEHLDAAMLGHDDLRYGTHAYGIAADGSVVAVFGWSLESRAADSDDQDLSEL